MPWFERTAESPVVEVGLEEGDLRVRVRTQAGGKFLVNVEGAGAPVLAYDLRRFAESLLKMVGPDDASGWEPIPGDALGRRWRRETSAGRG